jgi:hypothetical protein
VSTRTELVAAIRERYQRSIKADRRSILDEFVAVTGYHRKHAIRRCRLRASRPCFGYVGSLGVTVRMRARP